MKGFFKHILAYFDATRPSVNRVRPWGYYGEYGGDFQKSFSGYQRKELLKAARYLYANSSIVRGAFREQMDFSFPLAPQYVGADQVWGEMAEEWVREWMRICSVKGQPFTMGTHNRIRMLCRKLDGDIGTLLTRTETGYPQIQLIRGHRIGCRDGDEIVKDGPFNGFAIRDGVIKGRTGRVVGYRVLNDNGTHQDISSRSLILSFDPDFCDQDRGYSSLASSIEDFDDIRQTRSNEMTAQEIFSTQTLIETNEIGGADDATAVMGDGATSTSTPAYHTEGVRKGTIRYIRAGTGSNIQAFQHDRPSANVREFANDIITQALTGIGWEASFLLSIREPGGAWARTVLQKINKTIERNQECEARVMRTEIAYAVSVAISLGLLPAPKDGDSFSWVMVPTQGRVTADSGNDDQSKREDYKLGHATLRDLSMSRGGKWWEDIRLQKEREANDLLQRARRLVQANPEISLDYAINLIEQRNPNPPVIEQAMGNAPAGAVGGGNDPNAGEG